MCIRDRGGASNSSAADTQKKGVEFSDNSKRPEGSEDDPQIQMKTNKRLLKSNLDSWGGQSELRCYQQGVAWMKIMSLSH